MVWLLCGKFSARIEKHGAYVVRAKLNCHVSADNSCERSDNLATVDGDLVVRGDILDGAGDVLDGAWVGWEVGVCRGECRGECGDRTLRPFSSRTDPIAHNSDSLSMFSPKVLAFVVE